MRRFGRLLECDSRRFSERHLLGETGRSGYLLSLYRNEFDQLISEAAFDGSASSSELSTTSPEFGTDGNYAKCWIREDDGIYLYKTGSSRYEVEPLSEFLASHLASILCPSYVDYDLDFYRD